MASFLLNNNFLNSESQSQSLPEGQQVQKRDQLSNKINRKLNFGLKRNLMFTNQEEEDYIYDNRNQQVQPNIDREQNKTPIGNQLLDEFVMNKNKILFPSHQNQSSGAHIEQIKKLSEYQDGTPTYLNFQFSSQNGEQNSIIQLDGNTTENRELSQRLEDEKQNQKSYFNELIDSKKQLSLSQVPKGNVLETQLIKNDNGLNYFYPQYDLILSANQNHIASCKKQPGSIGANYYISTQPINVCQKDSNYLGKVRTANQQNTFNIFQNTNSNQFITKQLVATVKTNLIGGIRKIQAYILKDSKFLKQLKGYQPENKQQTLMVLFKIDENQQYIYFLQSKKPKWQPQKKRYILNFGKRVKQPSVLNFILQDAQTQRDVLLFGKKSQENYVVDIMHPLTPWLALAIIIPQFEKN